MIDITVTVAGPGGVISYEVEVIRRALVAAGIKVDLQDAYPPVTKGWFEATEAKVEAGEIKKYTVTLVADHQPWGG